MNSIQRLHDLGQSVWLEGIQGDLIASGEFDSLLSNGEIRGVVLNPSTLLASPMGRRRIDSEIRQMSQAGWGSTRIIKALSTEAFRWAAGRLLPLYETSEGKDGFVTVWINPQLETDEDLLFQEIQRVWLTINRPNVMVGIPGTHAGIAAMQRAVQAGVNVNAISISSLQTYEEVLEAYLLGLERRNAEGLSLNHISSVVSVLVPPLDRVINQRLQHVIQAAGSNAPRAEALLSKIGIANAKQMYVQFEITLNSQRFAALRSKGANVQRLLWVSSGVEPPELPGSEYVASLIHPHTVTCLSLDLMRLLRAQDRLKAGFGLDLGTSRAHLEGLETLAISLDEETRGLEEEQGDQRRASYDALLDRLDVRVNDFREEIGPLARGLSIALQSTSSEDIVRRIADRDLSLWSIRKRDEPESLVQLDWLDGAADEADVLAGGLEGLLELKDLDLLLLHSGGNLASASTLAGAMGSTSNTIRRLSNLDPASIRAFTRQSPIDRSFFLVYSKEGEEGLWEAAIRHVWKRASHRTKEDATQRFLVLSPSQSSLSSVVEELGLHSVELPHILASRFSLLNSSNLLLASMVGVDIERVMKGARQMANRCKEQEELTLNPGFFLGCLLAEAYRQGRVNIAVNADRGCESFLEWFEWAFSCIGTRDGSNWNSFPRLPLQGAFQPDRWLRIYFSRSDDPDPELEGSIEMGIPAMIIQVDQTLEGLGSIFYMLQYALLVASHMIGAQPFANDEAVRQRIEFGRRIPTYIASPPERAIWWTQAGVVLWELPDRNAFPAGSTLAELVEEIERQLTRFESIELMSLGFHGKAWSKRFDRLATSLANTRGKAVLQREGLAILEPLWRAREVEADRMITLLLDCSCERDEPIPDLDYSFSDLQRGLACLTLDLIKQKGAQVVALHFNSPKEAIPFFECWMKSLKSR